MGGEWVMSCHSGSARLGFVSDVSLLPLHPRYILRSFSRDAHQIRKVRGHFVGVSEFPILHPSSHLTSAIVDLSLASSLSVSRSDCIRRRRIRDYSGLGRWVQGEAVCDVE
jgi:hypothetical protein